MQIPCVLCQVGTKSFNIIYISFRLQMVKMLPKVFSPEVGDPATYCVYVPTHSRHFKNVVVAWLVKI
jgi:hypothetical protein